MLVKKVLGIGPSAGRGQGALSRRGVGRFCLQALLVVCWDFLGGEASGSGTALIRLRRTASARSFRLHLLYPDGVGFWI